MKKVISLVFFLAIILGLKDQKLDAEESTVTWEHESSTRVFETSSSSQTGFYKVYCPWYKGVVDPSVSDTLSLTVDTNPLNLYILFYNDDPSSMVEQVLDGNYSAIPKPSSGFPDYSMSTLIEDDCQSLTSGKNLISLDEYEEEGKLNFVVFMFNSKCRSKTLTCNKPEIEIEMFVDSRPQIDFDNGDTSYLYFDIEKPLSLDKIKSMFGAYDEYDGKITDSLVFETTYDEENVELDTTYDLNVSATDSTGNTASLLVKLVPKDIKSPIISNEYNEVVYKIIKLSEYDNLESFKNDYDDISNYTSDNSITITDYDSDLTYDIDTSGLTLTLTNEAKKQCYVNITVTDTSGNSSTTKVLFEVVDDIDPTVSLSTSSVNHDYKGEIDMDTIKSYVIASDNVFDNENLIIDIDMSSYECNKVGSYNINITVSDKANNSKTVLFICNVVDETIPIIFTKTQQIILDDTASMDDIKNLISAMYKDLFPTQMNEYQMVSVSSEYFDVLGLGGKYDLKATFVSLESGESYVCDVNLDINETTADNNPKLPKELNFFESIWYFIKNLFIDLIEYLTYLWLKITKLF